MGILEGLFKDKSNNAHSKEIETLNTVIKEKDLEIEKLKAEMQVIKDKYIPPKQVEIFERNLKALRDENNKLKKEKEELQISLSSYESLNSQEKSFNLSKFSYKLSADEFFSGQKFNLIREFLNKYGVVFIQDFEKVINSKELNAVKNFSSAKKKYSAFHEKGEVSWDERVSLCRGERVQKVFKKSRKFINYLLENNIEFMDDMLKFNFDELAVKGGFSLATVEELKSMTKEYFDTYKI